MDSRHFLHVLEELFELDPGVIDLDTPVRNIPGLDSLTFVGLIATIDEEFQVALDPQAILRCASLAELLDLIEGHTGGHRRVA